MNKQNSIALTLDAAEAIQFIVFCDQWNITLCWIMFPGWPYFKRALHFQLSWGRIVLFISLLWIAFCSLKSSDNFPNDCEQPSIVICRFALFIWCQQRYSRKVPQPTVIVEIPKWVMRLNIDDADDRKKIYTIGIVARQLRGSCTP